MGVLGSYLVCFQGIIWVEYKFHSDFRPINWVQWISLKFWLQPHPKEKVLRPVVPGCAMAHPDFGRSVNPISTRGDRLCPPNYYWHTRIFRPFDGPDEGGKAPLAIPWVWPWVGFHYGVDVSCKKSRRGVTSSKTKLVFIKFEHSEKVEEIWNHFPLFFEASK